MYTKQPAFADLTCHQPVIRTNRSNVEQGSIAAFDFVGRRAEERKKAEEVSGQKLKKQTAEPSPKGDHGTAVKVIIVIVACALAAVIIGNRERARLR